MEVTDSNKHSSLLLYEINYSRKKFFDTGPRCKWQLEVSILQPTSYLFLWKQFRVGATFEMIRTE